MREARERLAQRARPGPLLPVHRERPQRTRLAVGLDVDAADDGRAVQQRQHVVAVRARVRRLVDLEAMLEAEQVLGLEAIPQQVVEGRQEERTGGLGVARERAVDDEAVRLRSAVKARDGFFTTYCISPYSRYLARWCARRGLTPNQVTTASLVTALMMIGWP